MIEWLTVDCFLYRLYQPINQNEITNKSILLYDTITFYHSKPLDWNAFSANFLAQDGRTLHKVTSSRRKGAPVYINGAEAFLHLPLVVGLFGWSADSPFWYARHHRKGPRFLVEVDFLVISRFYHGVGLGPSYDVWPDHTHVRSERFHQIQSQWQGRIWVVQPFQRSGRSYFHDWIGSSVRVHWDVWTTFSNWCC